MRSLSSSLLVCLLLTLGLSAYAENYTEDDVAVTPNVAGKLVTPTGPTHKKVDRAVLILHGWQDHMDGAGNLQAKLAAALGNRGMASLRINFRGEGERNDYVVTSTYQSRVDDASAAFQYLRLRFPDARFGVQGWSLGGLTSMAIAGRHPDWFESMVLWSAAERMRLNSDPTYNEAARRAITEGRAAYKTWADMTLTREFLSSYIGVNVSLGLPGYPGAFLSIRGDKDFLPSHDRRWLELLPTQDKSFLLIGGADHIFNVFDPASPHSRRVMEATVDWFDRTL